MSRKMFSLLLAVLIIVGLHGAPCSAEQENRPENSRLLGAFIPKTGSWSEYALYDTATDKRTVVRMSIVGDKNDSYWYETVIKDGKAPKIVKMMITGDPDNPENIKRIIVKSGAEPARELDPDSVIEMGTETGRKFQEQIGIPRSSELDLKVIKTGKGTVTVPAGTFEVSLYQVMDTTGKKYADYKFSEEVHPFGIVTTETEDITMVLVGHGTEAESLITEEPEMMDQSRSDASQGPEGMEQESRTRENREGLPESTIRQIPGMGTGYEPKQ